MNGNNKKLAEIFKKKMVENNLKFAETLKKKNGGKKDFKENFKNWWEIQRKMPGN